MVSRRTIFWEVDTQVDFMQPDGKLYVPGSEKILPNVTRMVDAARAGRVFLVSDACVHTMQDEEFKHFPPHCVRGTPGAAVLPQALAERMFVIPNRADAPLPADFREVQQVILEKQTLSVFDNPKTERVIERLKDITDPDAEFVVFGVVTEYCVRLAAKGLLERGRRVAVVTDAIETMNPEDGRKALEELAGMGARQVTTDQALALLESAAGQAG